MGNSIISRLTDRDGKAAFDSEASMQERLKPDTPIGSGEWVDISGLIAPKSEIEELMQRVEKGLVDSLEQVQDAFRTMQENYYSYEWTWVFQHIGQIYGINPSRISKDEVISLVLRWKEAVVKLDRMIYDDASKEFNLASKTGFGADGDKSRKESDFTSVRGDFESNPFVCSVLKHIRVKSALGDSLIAALQSL